MDGFEWWFLVFGFVGSGVIDMLCLVCEALETLLEHPRKKLLAERG